MGTPERDSADLLKAAQTLMQQSQFEAALSSLRPLLDRTPADRDALYMAAVCHRYLQDHDAAGKVLSQLKALSPDFGRAWQEEGHLARDRQQPEAAIRAYEAAVVLNPALAACWRELARLNTMLGRTQQATQAQAQVDRLARWPQPVHVVANLLYEGKLLKAEELCRAFLKKNPTHVEAMRLLAEIGVRLGVLNDAEFLLESAAAFEPDNPLVRLDYIQVLRKRQKFDAAVAQAQVLYDMDPESPMYQSALAIEKLQMGAFDEALALFDRVLERVPRDPATLTSRGHALKTLGRQEDAVASYRAAIEAKPDHGDAFSALANLKTYRFDTADKNRMAALLSRPDLLPNARVHLHFALAKAHEDDGDYAAAFEHYDKGNSLKRQQSSYTPERMDEEFAAQKAHCTPALFSDQQGQGCPAPDPIFIVGLPRAGSTLIEQILASHSQVDGTLELPNILSMVQELRGRDRRGTGEYPACLHDLGAGRLAELGERYIEETRVHRQGAPFFTDKMPNNFRHIGLISLILPNAKIVDARREPMACCFSGFKQLFAEGQEFTYGLERVGRYYRGYVDLMAHWDKVLPGKVLRVQHEDVVADLEGQVRRLLDYCGLPFEQACVDFHKTERAVRTASSEQVRQPISDRGLAQWTHFEPWLDELKAALGPDILDGGYRN